MSRQGSEYERFVYDKFCVFFPGATVTLNDKILGNQSNLMREIDISIKFNIEGKKVLYIVQCKDRGTRPADIVILGEFSSAIKDVGAAKGFLICTSGFAKSNYKYASSIGVELLTVEDITSNRWRANVQIPLIYVKKILNYTLHGDVIINAQFARKHKRNPQVSVKFSIDDLMTFSERANYTTIKEYVQQWMNRAGAFLGDAVDIDLQNPGLQLKISGVWLRCKELQINLATTKKYYLKYLTPDQYSQIRDHRRNITVPLNIKVGGPGQLDDSFIEVPGSDLPVTPVIYAVLEEWTDLERASGKAPALNHNQSSQHGSRGARSGDKNRVQATQQNVATIIPFSTELPGPDFCSVPVPDDVGQDSQATQASDQSNSA